ncbi:MAG: hydroxymethylglutaryl-CoA lyase [Bacteroidota bacterium]|jgi:hydroxymethylglutaryl-CoA lyase
MKSLQIVECPRDAFQGIQEHIPTEKKIAYINQLLRCGFHSIDFGSFVSPKMIPQMADTIQVLKGLVMEGSTSKLLAIVANLRGAQEAAAYDEITYIGFPFSISETFQKRNTNAGMEEALTRIEEIQSICMRSNKTMVVYISMAFGNPYGDPWNADLATAWAKNLAGMGIQIISLADTVGVSTPANIRTLFGTLIPELPTITIGAHLHSPPAQADEKIAAALQSGCTRFDAAVKGFGGCPMASDALTGNIATEMLLQQMNNHGLKHGVDEASFAASMMLAGTTFPPAHA